MTIALDLEGVLADTVGAVLREYNEENGTNIQKGDWHNYGFNGIEMSKDEFMSRSEEIWQDRWTDILPEDDPETVRDCIRSTTHEVHLVTARQNCDSQIEEWLAHYGIPYEEYHSVEGSKAVLQDRYDVFIDDNPNLIWQVPRMLVVAQPWNMHEGLPVGHERVPSASEAFRWFSQQEESWIDG